MGEKRPIEELSDELTITPLGAGQEVGRSCILLQFKGKRVLLDIGIHPGLSGLEALPFIDVIDTSQIGRHLQTYSRKLDGNRGLYIRS